MSTIRGLWIPVLLAALVAMLIGPGTVSAAEPRTTWGKIMVPAAAFIPVSASLDYSNSGVHLVTGSGSGYFTAPLTFPVPTVRIRKITLYGHDSGITGSVCADLHRASPPTRSEVWMGGVCTSDSPADPQAASTTAVSPRRVNTASASPYLWLYLSGPSDMLYGVAITYSYET